LRIPPFRLVSEPLDEEARNTPGFKWADQKIGKRHQLGGDPDFLQQAAYPLCQACGEMMTFYAQLDSISDKFCIADCGMIYVFVCMGCNTTTSFIQSF
jgi:hypothetical protein